MFYDNTAGAYRMAINSSGNVGFGTHNPSSHVYITSANTTATDLQLANTSASGRNWKIGATGSANTGGVGDLTFYDATASLTRLTIKPSGNVGIGTTSPGAKLAVAGTGGTDGIQYPDGTLQTTASTTNSNGSVTLGSSVNLTAGAGAYNNTGMSVTLPAAGTYLVQANVRGAVTPTSVGNNFITALLYNTTDGAAVANSQRLVVYIYNTNYAHATVPITAVVTVAAAKTIALYAFWTCPASCSPNIGSDSNGATNLTYVKLSN